ncbi:MAG: adenosylcobinamide-GDP ribazoletransferase [Oscillospiraceae bacterium]
MNMLRSVAMAFSMFSAIPMPLVEWKNSNMQYILAVFPLVGVVIGFCLWVWCRLCTAFDIGTVLFAAGLTLIPVAISGGIHMDGFCDTTDALASHATSERKREILKDSHTGAFAVIGVCMYFLLYFALCTELTRGTELGLIVGTIPVMSRAISGLAGICFPTSGGGGLLNTFQGSAKRTAAVFILVLFLLICTAALIGLDFWAGISMIAAALLCGLYVYFMSRRQFGGMSGDISGFLLQITELAMLFTLLITQKAVSI